MRGWIRDLNFHLLKQILNCNLVETFTWGIITWTSFAYKLISETL